MRIYADEQTPLLLHAQFTEGLRQYESLICNIQYKIGRLRKCSQELQDAQKSYANYPGKNGSAKYKKKAGEECKRLSAQLNHYHQGVCSDIDKLRNQDNDKANNS